MAKLPETTLQAITDVFRAQDESSDEPFSESDVSRVATKTGADRSLLQKTFVLAAFIGALIEEEDKEPQEVEARFATVIERGSGNPKSFAAFLRSLRDTSRFLSVLRDRRLAIMAGGRTINEISVSCDLRLLSRPSPSKTTAEGTAQAQISELIPVVIMRISFGNTDDGEDCTLQLSPNEVKRLIAQLRQAEDLLAAANSQVSISPR
jgi:hypothetical protein